MSTSRVSAAPERSGDVTRGHRVGTGLLVTPVIYVVAAAMMGLVFASSPPARLLEGLADFEQGRVLYQWGFVGASLLAPTFVSMLLLLAAAAGVPTSSVRRSVAGVLLGAYVAFASLAYTSQYTFLPDLVDRDPAAAAVWYFHDVGSIPYAIDLAGYTLLGAAALLLAGLVAERGRRWLAGWLVAMGGLSIAAFVLHAAGAGSVGGILSLTSAVCTVPIAALAVIEGRRLRADAHGGSDRPTVASGRTRHASADGAGHDRSAPSQG
jgi:hypothetical protein